MKDKKQRWFYTIWITLNTVLYIGLLVLSWYLDHISFHSWVRFLVDILRWICVFTGFIMLFTICRKAEDGSDAPDSQDTEEKL